MIYETDTNRVLVWDNAAWVMIADTDTPPGMQLVGKGTFTANDLIADGVFTTEFDRYVLKTNISLSNTASEIRVQFRTSSANNSTSNYQHQNTYFATSAGFDRNTTSTTSALLAQNVGAAGWDMNLEITGPATTTTTRIILSGSVSTGTLPIVGNVGFQTTTAFDGIRIFPSTGNITGAYEIYGYRK
jgi:hypothetical protein